MLASLGKWPANRADLVASLASFDTPDAVDAVIKGFTARGWAEQDGSLLRLTSSGTDQHALLAPRVGEVRRSIKAALPQDDYIALIRLLSRLTEAV